MPAIMYYVTVILFVHYEAQKYGLKGQPRENLPKLMKLLGGITSQEQEIIEMMDETGLSREEIESIIGSVDSMDALNK